ncbi:MAG: primase alpha helix C-terminal domain-containing protein [Porticoccaceae bacterium]
MDSAFSRQHKQGGDTTQLGIEERQALFTGEIPKGQRNETLFKLGSILRGKGYSRNSIAVEMSEANLLRCKPKLKDEEVLQIIDRIVKYDAGGKSMKTQWQESVLSDKALDAKAKCVAMGLSLFADAQGRNCYPNQNHIAERTAFNRKTIAKHLDTFTSKAGFTVIPEAAMEWGFLMVIC